MRASQLLRRQERGRSIASNVAPNLSEPFNKGRRRDQRLGTDPYCGLYGWVS